MLEIIILPIVTAFIGWLTNWVAIEMLFRPRKARSFLFFSWQGLIPRRQQELADQMSVIVERELLNQHLLRAAIESVDLKPVLGSTIQKMVREKLVPWVKTMPLLGALLNEEMIARIEKTIEDELEREARPVLEKVSAKVEEQFNVREIVRERIASFDLEKLESIILGVARKEFRTIERLGAVLGFIIGWIQLGLIKYLEISGGM